MASSITVEDHLIQDAYDAIDLAECLTEGPAKRNFLRTGELTTGFRASVDLHRHIDSGYERLALYVQQRVENGDLAGPADWPA